MLHKYKLPNGGFSRRAYEYYLPYGNFVHMDVHSCVSATFLLTVLVVLFLLVKLFYFRLF
jgi:hypothetical protein